MVFALEDGDDDLHGNQLHLRVFRVEESNKSERDANLIELVLHVCDRVHDLGGGEVCECAICKVRKCVRMRLKENDSNFASKMGK